MCEEAGQACRCHKPRDGDEGGKTLRQLACHPSTLPFVAGHKLTSTKQYEAYVRHYLLVLSMSEEALKTNTSLKASYEVTKVRNATAILGALCIACVGMVCVTDVPYTWPLAAGARRRGHWRVGGAYHSAIRWYTRLV